MKKILTLLLLCIFTCNIYAANNSTSKGAWSYKGENGPEVWGKLDSSYKICSEGKEQSPIDITTTVNQKADDLKIQYQAAPLAIVNEGLTTFNINGKKTVVNDGHTIQVNFPENKVKEVIDDNGERYHLVQVHFHAPSENKLNGNAFAGEMHFVNQTKSGKLLVVGVFIKVGKENTELAKILSNLPSVYNKLTVMENVKINPANFLPQDTAHYKFVGSLTTPPCNEGVQWIVMQQPIEASSEQITQLKQAIGEENARPVQPLNDRKVTLISNH